MLKILRQDLVLKTLLVLDDERVAFIRPVDYLRVGFVLEDPVCFDDEV